jgi:glycine/D-amino acid oxidase-like deaminating enzyme
LQESCSAVGVTSSLLSAAEVNGAYRQLQLPPHRSSGLLQPDGGVIRAAQAAAAARQLATNAGVMIRVSPGRCHTPGTSS